jgi:hypothetical protein
MIILSTKQIKIRRTRYCDTCRDAFQKGAFMNRHEVIIGNGVRLVYECLYCEIIKIVERENKLFDKVVTEE